MARSRPDEFVDTFVVLAATAALLGGFAPLFEGGRWAVVVLSVLAPVAAVTAAVRWWAPSWATPAGALTGVLMVVWVFVPGTTVLGLPTPRSVSALGDLVGRSRAVVVEEVAPIRPPESVVLLVAAAFLVLLVLADAVARQTWRVPLLGLLWSTMLVVPSIISTQMPHPAVFAGAAAAWLWVWWSGSPHAGPVPSGTAAATGVGAVALALLLPAVAPEIEPTSSDFGVTETQVFGNGINPMIQLGRNLRQSEPRRVLTYTSDAMDGQYLKVATLRQFSGLTWSPSPVFAEPEIEGVDDLTEAVDTREVTTRFRIESLRSSFLPVPYPAIRVDGLDGEWQWLRDGSTVRAEGATTTEDQTYTVTSLDRRPTANQIRGSGTPSRDLNTYRQLPRGVPGIVSRLARENSGDAENNYDRMVALQDWLRADFTYSVEAPVEEGYDGNGLDVMGEFLQRRAGYCVHFASTLAVMGRLLDIPTRVAIGYAPVESAVQRTSDGATFEVQSDDLHAWTEAFFPGIGWIGFDATPSIGESTSFAEEVKVDDGSGEDLAVPEGSDQGEQTFDARDDATAAEAEAEPGSPWRGALLALMVIAALGTVPAAVRQVRRRRRWSEGRSSSEPLWNEIADTARDLGIEPDPAETPRGFARRLSTHGVDTVPLDRVVSAVEAARYAGGLTTTSSLTEAQQVVQSLEAARGRRTRWLARIAPRSLLR